MGLYLIKLPFFINFFKLKCSLMLPQCCCINKCIKNQSVNLAELPSCAILAADIFVFPSPRWFPPWHWCALTNPVLKQEIPASVKVIFFGLCFC